MHILKFLFICYPGGGEIFLLIFIISYLPTKIRHIVKWIFLIISGSIFISDMFLLYSFQDVLDQAKIEIIAGTNPRTVIEFVKMYIMHPFVLVTLLIIAVLVILLNHYFKRRPFSISLKLSRWHKACSCLVILSFILSVVGLGKVIAKTYWSSVKTGEPIEMEQIGQFFYVDVSLNRFFMDAYAAYASIGNIQKINDELLAHREDILENYSDIPYVIFVLGESTDRNKMSVYGYRLKTNPLLEKRMDRDNIYFFDDTIACDTNTTGAMRKIFTFAEKDDKKEWYENADLMDILHDAGYKTYWISNQSPVNIYGNMDRIYSMQASKSEFTATQGGQTGTVKSHLDEELFPLLDEELRQPTGKDFYVLHLYGTHGAYNLRYPSGFAEFTAEDEDGDNFKQKQTKAEYDNAVLYNDWIMNEIIRRFEDKDAIVIYISDHGEEVYDGRDFAGHSSETHGNVHMIETPMMIWTSNEFAEKRPELVQRMRSSVHRPYRTDWLINTMLDFMQIRVPSFDASKSVINPAFMERTRMWNGKPYVHHVDKSEV